MGSKPKNKSKKVRASKGKSLRNPQAIAAALRTATDAHYQGDLSGAKRLYQQVYRAEAKNAAALNGLGMIAHQQAQPGRAIRYLRAALSIDGRTPGFHMNLGAALEANNELTLALDSYQQAIELDPLFRDPYYNLANAYLKQQQPEQAIAVLDSCQHACGRDFHALAYLAHALLDAGRAEEAQQLLDHDGYVHRYAFDPPERYANLDAFNAALASFVSKHPTLQKNVMSTERGSHTGDLLKGSQGPLFDLEPQIHKAVRWYMAQIPDEPSHPMRQWQPKLWKLTTWGVVMGNGGHERTHIHPNGWLSGVFYVDLPELIEDPAREHEGWLRFGQPTPDLAVQSVPELIDYQPSYGKIILFPSYFYHGTVPFHSKQRRICVSFDVEPLG